MLSFPFTINDQDRRHLTLSTKIKKALDAKLASMWNLHEIVPFIKLGSLQQKSHFQTVSCQEVLEREGNNPLETCLRSLCLLKEKKIYIYNVNSIPIIWDWKNLLFHLGKCPNDTPKDVSVGINVSKNSKMFYTLIEQSRYQEREKQPLGTLQGGFLTWKLFSIYRPGPHMVRLLCMSLWILAG